MARVSRPANISAWTAIAPAVNASTARLRPCSAGAKAKCSAPPPFSGMSGVQARTMPTHQNRNRMRNAMAAACSSQGRRGRRRVILGRSRMLQSSAIRWLAPVRCNTAKIAVTAPIAAKPPVQATFSAAPNPRAGSPLPTVSATTPVIAALTPIAPSTTITTKA